MPRIKHYTESTVTKFDEDSGNMKKFPVLNPSGTAGVTVGDDEYWADDEGWIDVPPEVAEQYLGKPGWRQDIGEPYPGEVVPVRHESPEPVKTPAPRKSAKAAAK